MSRPVPIAAISGASITALLLSACAGSVSSARPEASLTSRVATLEANLSRLNERQKIGDLYVRFTRGFDRMDAELIRSVFWPDAKIYYGTEATVRDEFVASHLPRHERFGSYAHHITSQAVDIRGDVAHVESNLIALFRDEDDKVGSVIGFRYLDRLDRRNGEWRVSIREAIPNFHLTADSKFDESIKAFWPNSDCWLGTRDRRDPSYQRPLNPRTNVSDGPPCLASPSKP